MTKGPIFQEIGKVYKLPFQRSKKKIDKVAFVRVLEIPTFLENLKYR